MAKLRGRLATESEESAEASADEATRLRLRIEALEMERNVYASALRIIRGPADLSYDDLPDGPGRAYERAGGGCEGLQAVAEWGLALAERLLGERGDPVEIVGQLPYPERAVAEPCACGREVQPGQLYRQTAEGPRHIGC